MYGDFADYCLRGQFHSEALFFCNLLGLWLVLWLVGNWVRTIKAYNSRLYTVLIGPPGSGKGTAITAARQFVGVCEFDSQLRSWERPLLSTDAHDSQNWCWPSRGIGAHVVSPASAPGLIQATKPHKLEKGESHATSWSCGGHCHVSSPFRKRLAACLQNLQMKIQDAAWRRPSWSCMTVMNSQQLQRMSVRAKSGRLLYSVLGGIPKTEWDNIFARASSVGSGLFSRLNIIGTENDRTVASLPEYDFGEMQRQFLPRITALERTPARIPVSPTARGLLNEWFARLSDEMKTEDLPAARLNIHALRVALHLAWLRGHANILESDIDAGIKVADFQAKMRDFYRPAEGKTREAQWEARIMEGDASEAVYRIQGTAKAVPCGPCWYCRLGAGQCRI